jgi:Family of unknown function (DUF5763)
MPRQRTDVEHVRKPPAQAGKFQQMIFGALARKGLRSAAPALLAGRKPKAPETTCAHKIQRWKQVPHPRYGTKVAHFISWIESDPNCACKATLRETVAAVTEVDTQCNAIKRDGGRCSRKSVADGYCRQHGG